MCHMSSIMYHMSCVLCYMSCVTRHMSCVNFFCDNVVDFVGGESVIHKTYPVYLFDNHNSVCRTTLAKQGLLTRQGKLSCMKPTLFLLHPFAQSILLPTLNYF